MVLGVLFNSKGIINKINVCAYYDCEYIANTVLSVIIYHVLRALLSGSSVISLVHTIMCA